MAIVETYTLQEIGHNSGDVIHEEPLITFEMGALLDEAARWQARHPRLDWAAALRVAGQTLLNRARREAAQVR